MKSFSFFSLAFLAIAPLALGVPAKKDVPENIIFIGDSITQGGSFLKGAVPSYRYQLFKNFVDNDLPFRPMGMTQGASKNVNVSALTPDYRGVKFVNVSEAAASGRSYQYAGHEQDSVYKSDPGVVFPVENRGPVTLKLGLRNSFCKEKNSFYDGTTLKEYTGATYPKTYGKEKPDTLCVMIGINDLYDQFQSDKKIAEHVHNIVKAYQQYNPKIRVYVFELLPTAANNGTGTKNKNNYGRYNNYLRSLNIEKKWSKGASRVSLECISQGFYAEDGSMCDGPSGAHPNAQGELIVAGNIARVLGVGQRNAGLKRVPAENLRESNFATNGKGIQKSGNNIEINSSLAGTADLRYQWPQKNKAHDCTLAFTIKMKNKKSADNFVATMLGNGEQVGVLYIGEKGLFWNDKNNIIYGTKDIATGTPFCSEKPVDVRIAYLKKGETGVKPGFYVWLNDQLVGEGLAGQTSGAIVENYANSILIGDIGNGIETAATISVPAIDAKNAVAPACN